jgi:hypothetical protein
VSKEQEAKKDKEVEKLTEEIGAQVRKLLKEETPSPVKMQAIKLGMSYIALKAKISSRHHGEWFTDDEGDEDE